MSGGHTDHGASHGAHEPTGHHGPTNPPATKPAETKTDEAHVPGKTPTSAPADNGKTHETVVTPSKEGVSIAGSQTEAATHCRNGCCSAKASVSNGPVNVNVTVPSRTEEADKKSAAVWKPWEMLLTVLLIAISGLSLALAAAFWMGVRPRGIDTGAAPRIERAADPVKAFRALGDDAPKVEPVKEKSSSPAAPMGDGEALDVLVDDLAKRASELQSALQLNREEDQGTLALAQDTAKEVDAVKSRVENLEARAAAPAPPSEPTHSVQASNPNGWSDVEMGIARRLISRLREITYYEMNPGHEKLRAEAFSHAQQEEANWQRQSRRPVPSRGELDRVFPVGRR
jgi:hypothetical protein